MTEFRGRLKALSFADILEFLRVLNRPGLLSLSVEGTTIGLYLRDGRIVHGASTRESDRLSDLLLRRGTITRDQCDQAMRRAAAGEKLGKALVDRGGLTPRALMEARLHQVQQMAVSLFEWEDGDFVFLESEAPQDEGVEVDLPIATVLVEGLRSVRNLALFRKRIPFDWWIFEAISEGERSPAVALEPQEIYVLRLVDGERAVGDVIRLSEFGEPETLRTLFLLLTVGRLKMKARPAPEVADAPSADGFAGIVQRYNGMFGMVYQYLMKEVGPISEHLLARSLRELEATYPVLFHRTTLGGDGTVDARLLQENVRSLADEPGRAALIQGLNELLYAELYVLRKTLGPQHEGRILRAFREARPPGDAAGSAA